MSSTQSSEMVAALVERMRGREETDDRSKEALEMFQGIARWIPRAISPFMDLHSAMCAALPSEDSDEIDENDKKNFDRIMKFHPRFPELILGFKDDPDAYDNFVVMMVDAFGSARATDTNSARYEVPTFVPLDPLVDVVQPPITKNKSSRGFNHPVVGKLLCPLRLLPEYEEDPVLFKNKVENATIRLRSHDERNWPSFLYPPGTEYNINELDKNLFRGPIVIRTLRMIYTGKSSALTGHRSAPKPLQAEMHGMREVFPEAVAYAAVQAYYGLCSLDGWHTEDRFFKLDTFFNKCVRLFTEDPNDPWVTDTLQFLTRQMPALTRRGKRSIPADIEDEEDGLGNVEAVGILAQRAARREAAREQETGEGQVRNQGTLNEDLNEEDDDRQPLTPPPSSPARQEGRNHGPESAATQRHRGRNLSRTSSPTRQRGRSRSSSLHLTPSPPPSNRIRRTPARSNGRQPATTLSPTREPLGPSVRSNVQRTERNTQPIQQHAPRQSDAMCSSSRLSDRQAPPAPATSSTSRTKAKKSAPSKRRKKN